MVVDGAAFVPKQRDFDYLEAVALLYDEGRPVNLPNLGELLGITKQAVWKYQRENPQLMAWVNSQIRGVASQRVGGVIRKLAEIAERGSAEHAKLYLQVMGELRDKVEHEAGPSLLQALAEVEAKRRPGR